MSGHTVTAAICAVRASGEMALQPSGMRASISFEDCFTVRRRTDADLL